MAEFDAWIDLEDSADRQGKPRNLVGKHFGNWVKKVKQTIKDQTDAGQVSRPMPKYQMNPARIKEQSDVDDFWSYVEIAEAKANQPPPKKKGGFLKFLFPF